MWLQRIYGRAKKRVNPCHLGGQAPRTENEMGIKEQIQPAADMPDTHRRAAHGKPHGAYKGMLSDKNKKPPLEYYGGWVDLVNEGSKNTHNLIRESQDLCRALREGYPREGNAYPKDAQEIISKIQDAKQRLNIERNLILFDALLEDSELTPSKPIQNSGLVVHHVMEESGKNHHAHWKTRTSTFFLEFNKGHKCCPTLDEWKQITAQTHENTNSRLKTWLVKAYTDDIGMRTEEEANAILESGVVEHLVKTTLDHDIVDWVDKRDPFTTPGINVQSGLDEANTMATKLIDKQGGHFLRYVYLELTHETDKREYTHKIRLHYGACDPMKNTLVCHVVSTEDFKPGFVHPATAETFEQQYNWREEIVCIPKIVEQINKHMKEKTDLIEELTPSIKMIHKTSVEDPSLQNDSGNEEDFQDAHEHLHDDNEPLHDDNEPPALIEPISHMLFTYFAPRASFPDNDGITSFSDSFSVLYVRVMVGEKIYKFTVFSQLIPPVKRRMTYHFDTGHKYKEGHYMNLVDEHGKHLIYDPVITEFYQKQDQKRADVFYRDQQGVPYTVQIKVVDGARHPTVRMCEWLAGIESKVPKLLSDLKETRAYTDLKNGEDLANRERQHVNCYHKVYHVKQQGFRTRYYPGAAQHYKQRWFHGAPVKTPNFKSEFTLLPPNPRRALQLGSQVHPDPGNHAMSTIVVDLAEIKRFINSMVQSNLQSSQEKAL